MKYIITSVTLILLIVSCQKNDIFDHLGDSEIDPTMIGFTITNNNLLTRGTPREDDGIKGGTEEGLDIYNNNKVNVWALSYSQDKSWNENPELNKYFTTKLTNSGSWNTPNWGYSPDEVQNRFYPSDKKLAFVAFASDLDDGKTTDYWSSVKNANGLSISSIDETNMPIITYEVPTTVEDQPDLLVTLPVVDRTSGKVTLQMKHALSCVSFIATSLKQNRAVFSITLKNVISKGSLNMNQSSIDWQLNEESKSLEFSPIINSDLELEEDKDLYSDYSALMDGKGYLMMLPQTLSNAIIEVILWDGTNELSKEEPITLTLPNDIKWEAGLKYIYHFGESRDGVEGIVTYYETYADNSLGLFYNDGKTQVDQLKNDQSIIDAGYGILVPAYMQQQYSNETMTFSVGDNIKSEANLYGSGATVAYISNRFENSSNEPIDCVLFTMTQNNYPFNNIETAYLNSGIAPVATNTAMQVSASLGATAFSKVYDYCLPHYARGVYTTADQPTTHNIRTPIQMRNISYQTSLFMAGQNYTISNTYIQEFETMDYKGIDGNTIRGSDVGATGDFKQSIVKGYFRGTFDGANGYNNTKRSAATIDNLVISALANTNSTGINNRLALFDALYTNGNVRNLTNTATCSFMNNNNYVNINTNGDMGYLGVIAAFVGENSGTIENLTNRATVTNSSTGNGFNAGGIVGYNIEQLSGCINYAAITNSSASASNLRVGGIVALNEKWRGKATLDNCKNEGTVSGCFYVGGIAGTNNYKGEVINCQNNGSIRRLSGGWSGTMAQVGGIVGLQSAGDEPPAAYQALVSNCINIGNITYFGDGNGNFGGIVGNNDFNWQADSPLTPATAFGHITQCRNVGNISGISSTGENGVGGITGTNNGKITVCQSTGLITGASGSSISVGGIAGYHTYYIADCLYYNSSYTPNSPITGGSKKGGLVGYAAPARAEFAIESSYMHRCFFAAIAPSNANEYFSPIAGQYGGYLYRDRNNVPNFRDNGVDATTGATPLYTVEDCFFASGIDMNLLQPGVRYNEPDLGVEPNIGPFKDGNYAMSIFSMSRQDREVLPFANWGAEYWIYNSTRPPYLSNFGDPGGSQYFLPESSSKTYILSDIARTIANNNTQTEITITPSNRVIEFGNRISLNNITDQELGNITRIIIDLNSITVQDQGLLVFRAPTGWTLNTTGTFGNNERATVYTTTITNAAGVYQYEYQYCRIGLTTSEQNNVIVIMEKP